MKMAEDFKAKGNSALSAGKWEEAVSMYTKAIDLEPNNHLFYSNRSAAYSKGEKYTDALNDAQKCIDLKSDWAKGYSRKGAALEFLNRFGEAKSTYTEGLKHDPSNTQLTDALEKLENKMSSNGDNVDISNIFAGPAVLNKLKKDSRTSKYCSDPSFIKMIEDVKANPRNMGVFMKDSRFMDAVAVLLNLPNDVTVGRDPYDDEAKPNAASSSTKPSSNKTQSEEKMDVDLSESERKALAEKELGNAAYKKKDFETALKHYDAAIELNPKDITFRNNKAAVYFEMKDYDKCISDCFEAVDIGRENRADFKLVSKSFSRAANAYLKKEDLANAKKYFEKSLTEFRAPDVVKKLGEVTKALKEKERLSYINPELAEEEKAKGNALFQEGKFPDAMKHYTEAIKRNPSDAKLFSNRSACYMKLMEFSLALSDADKCVEIDPSFVKGHSRRAACLVALKDNSKAVEAYRKVLQLDPNNQEAKNGIRQASMGINSDEQRERAMQDPEIQAILGDPGMQIILQQMQKDPMAVREHMQNPEIAQKLQKLITSGIVGYR